MGRSSVFSLEQIYRKQLTQTWSKIPEVFRFVNSLGLNFSSHSTQIELKDAMAYQLSNTHNLNNVLILWLT